MAATKEKLIALLEDIDGESGFRLLGYHDVRRIADHLIANGVTVQEWISVKDRLPERTDGHVLVTDGDKVKISCRNAMYQTRGGETWCAQNYGAGMCVTHWMLLPEPPKGE